jgi:hypothetical protein
LKRTHPNEKLGLTLCDGLPVNRTNSNGKTTANEAGVNVEEDQRLGSSSKAIPSAKEETAEKTKKAADAQDDFNEVFIQTIAADSLAAADGRLFQGDILLQVISISLAQTHC